MATFGTIFASVALLTLSGWPGVFGMDSCSEEQDEVILLQLESTLRLARQHVRQNPLEEFGQSDLAAQKDFMNYFRGPWEGSFDSAPQAALWTGGAGPPVDALVHDYTDLWPGAAITAAAELPGVSSRREAKNNNIINDYVVTHQPEMQRSSPTSLVPVMTAQDPTAPAARSQTVQFAGESQVQNKEPDKISEPRLVTQTKMVKQPAAEEMGAASNLLASAREVEDLYDVLAKASGNFVSDERVADTIAEPEGKVAVRLAKTSADEEAAVERMFSEKVLAKISALSEKKSVDSTTAPEVMPRAKTAEQNAVAGMAADATMDMAASNKMLASAREVAGFYEDAEKIALEAVGKAMYTAMGTAVRATSTAFADAKKKAVAANLLASLAAGKTEKVAFANPTIIDTPGRDLASPTFRAKVGQQLAIPTVADNSMPPAPAVGAARANGVVAESAMASKPAVSSAHAVPVVTQEMLLARDAAQKISMPVQMAEAAPTVLQTANDLAEQKPPETSVVSPPEMTVAEKVAAAAEHVAGTVT